VIRGAISAQLKNIISEMAMARRIAKQTVECLTYFALSPTRGPGCTKIAACPALTAAFQNMSRTFYILAAALLCFALLLGAVSFVPSSLQPGLPANASLWRTGSLFLLLACLAATLIGVLSRLFEQVDRRSEEAQRKSRSEKH
jgi:hypothetical protein